MRGLIAGLLLAGLAATAASPALAQAPTCSDILLKGGGAPIVLSAPLDEATRLGLSFSLAIGLDDSQSAAGLWPRDTIQTAPACPLRAFDAAGKRYTLSGGINRVPPRFATAPNGDTLALTILPSIPEGYAIHKRGAEGNVEVKRPISALVLLRPTRFFVLKLYDGQPADDALVEDMKAAATRSLPVLASFHPTSRAVSLDVAVASGRQAFFLRPPSVGTTALITGPDGDLFKAGVDGALILPASGFVCPADANGFSRGDMLVIDPADGGSDLACRFFGADSWFSAFVTRFDDGRSEEQQFKIYLAQGQQAAPPVGEVKIDKLPRGGRRAVWTDAEGQRQEMWLLRLGKWYVQLRVTATPGDAAAVDAAATALLDLARRSVHEGAV